MLLQHTSRAYSQAFCQLSRRTTQIPPYTTRTMASAAGKHEWIVVMPDNEGVLETRMEVRPDHLKGVSPKVEEGFWKFGGAFLDEPIKEGETPKIRGSVMLALASSKEEVVEQLKNDIYTKKGVWNWDKVQIYPFRSVFRKEL